MPQGQRVVIRSSWRAALAGFAPVLLIMVGAQMMRGYWVDALAIAVVVLLVSMLARFMYYVELTDEGLEIHRIRRQVVPWRHIDSVTTGDSWGGQYVAVHDANENRNRALPAPRGTFGVGRDDVEAARQVIEQWWMARRGAAPLPATALRPPGFVPGSEEDPYATPRSG